MTIQEDYLTGVNENNPLTGIDSSCVYQEDSVFRSIYGVYRWHTDNYPGQPILDMPADSQPAELSDILSKRNAEDNPIDRVAKDLMDYLRDHGNQWKSVNVTSFLSWVRLQDYIAKAYPDAVSPQDITFEQTQKAKSPETIDFRNQLTNISRGLWHMKQAEVIQITDCVFAGNTIRPDGDNPSIVVKDILVEAVRNSQPN